MRYFPALFFVLFSCSLFAQMESREQVLNQYLDNYNSQRASRDWATMERTDVTFTINENHTLVAVLGNGETQIDLDRSGADPMDGMLPQSIEQAFVVYTNATTLFIDPERKHHFAFTLLDEPQLPSLNIGYITLFLGDGIGRRAVVE